MKATTTITGAHVSSHWPCQFFLLFLALSRLTVYLLFIFLWALRQCTSGCGYKWFKFICNISIHMSHGNVRLLHQRAYNWIGQQTSEHLQQEIKNTIRYAYAYQHALMRIHNMRLFIYSKREFVWTKKHRVIDLTTATGDMNESKIVAPCSHSVWNWSRYTKWKNCFDHKRLEFFSANR